MKPETKNLEDFILTPGVWHVTFEHKSNKKQVTKAFHVAESEPVATFKMHTHEIVLIMRVR
jgi:hypothetical protein